MCNKALNCWWDERAKEAEQEYEKNLKHGRGGSLSKSLKQLERSYKKNMQYLLSKDGGTKITSCTEKLKRWCEHFENTTNIKSTLDESSFKDLDLYNLHLNDDLSVPLSVSEIEIAIKQSKRGSATGIDEISTELLLHVSETTVNWMKKLFDQIWKEEVVQSDWKKQITVPIPKKGNKFDCDNYRGIAVLCVASKIFS